MGRVAIAVPATGPTGDEVERALRELGDERFEVRERASTILFGAGPSVATRLREAEASGDPEVRLRSQSILGRFARGVYPDTPADVALMAERYESTDEQQKAGLIVQLAQSGGYGCVVLLKLAARENDPDL